MKKSEIHKERRLTMFHNRKLITVAVILAALVILGVVSGMAYAQTGTTTSANATGTNPKTTLFAKMASILGIDQTKLETAYTQAQSQIRDEQLTSQLKTMVDDGTMTQAQADAYLKWWQSRPDVANQLGFGDMQGMGGGPHGMMGQGGNAPPAPTATTATK
jgi:hypothetical protein